MKQSSRLVLTLIFLALLLLLSRVLYGSWFHWPAGDKSLWFQAGLLMVVLGSFFIEKHFTKPVDVVTNAIAGIITILAVERRDHFLFWSIALWAMVALAVMAFLSMAIQTFSVRPTFLKVGRALFAVSTFFGSARRLFSFLLFLSIFSFFQVPSRDSLLIFIFWAIVVSSEPLGIPGLIDRLIDSLRKKHSRIGKVFRMLGSNIYQVEVTTNAVMSLDSVVTINTPKEKIYCIPLDHVALSDKRLITVVGISAQPDMARLDALPDTLFAEFSTADQAPQSVQESRGMVERNNILGIVDDNSDIEQLRFRLLSSGHELQEGQLVKVYFGDKPVLYQIVNAITKSQTTEGNEERYISVIAQLVGVWDSEGCHFESVGWVAAPGTLVFAELANTEISLEPIPVSRAIIGNLPKSQYPIHVEIDEVVTHHTAILGITGSGKTVLAYELIRKMVARGIKVLVFDISGDYARDLASIPNTVKLSKTSEVSQFLNSDSFLGIAEFPPTSTDTIVKATAIAVQEVLKWAKTNLQSQHGENILAKVCVVFEEAHSLIPEWNSVSIAGDKDQVNKTSQAILQGRKYGVGALVITQRTANITKTILNQCNTIFALQSFDQTGLEFLKNYIGEGHAQALSTLLKRQVVVFGKASSSRRPVIATLKEVDLEALSQASTEQTGAQAPAASA